MSYHFSTFSEASESHGGKAGGLRLLIEGGFSVPDGMVLSVDEVDSLLAGDTAVTEGLAAWLEQYQGPFAVRSSALGEDGMSASYAGMFETKLNIEPRLENILKAIDTVSASGASDRVASYAGTTVDRIPVIVQRMLDPRYSGVSFTDAVNLDGTTCVYSEWVEGLGEQLVSGQVTPARIVVPWHTGTRTLDVRAASLGGRPIDSGAFDTVCKTIERLCRNYDGAWDIEWSIDDDGTLWLLQMRPITRTVLIPDTETSGTSVPASPGTASGPAFLVDDDDASALNEGDVLVAEITEVDFVPAMKRAAAIVTEHGGMLSHAAIVARELGKPCVVGVTGALSMLRPGVNTDVDGTNGIVTQGALALGIHDSQEIDWRSLCFYDRGLEVTAADHAVYVEALPTGLTAYSADELTPQQRTDIERDLRRQFRRPVTLVEDQKLLWYREWRRFDQIPMVSFLHAMFTSAIAAWNAEELIRVIDVVKSLAATSAREPSTSKLHELYTREIGAALHALCGVAVEGIGAWASYRDTALWRQQHGVRYDQMLLLSRDDPRTTPELARTLDCLAVLSTLRNESYPYFIETGAFTLEYFQTRADLVTAVCAEQKLGFIDETSSLDEIYGLAAFRAYHPDWLERAAESVVP
jgi:pyruvate,water dikinase